MIPPYTPDVLDKSVINKSYVDTNHVGNMANRRSHYVIIIYANNASIIWYSKQHNMEE